MKPAAYFKAWAAAAVLGALTVACSPPPSAKASEGVKARHHLPRGFVVFTDPVTGCEYLQLYDKAITPRMEWSGYSNESYRVKGCRR